MILVTIDPGDHMGWTVGTTEGGPYDAGTDTPAEFFLRLETWCGTAFKRTEDETWPGVNLITYQPQPGSVDRVVFEGFSIDGPQLIGSDVPTLQYIGVIKYICSRAGVPWEMQDRQVKAPARSKCKHLGIRPIPGDGHAKDAQLHWHAWVWRHPETHTGVTSAGLLG